MPKDKDSKRIEREKTDLQTALKSPEMRRVLWRVLEKAGAYRNPFMEGGGQRGYVDFNAGMQFIGQWLIEEIDKADPFATERLRREYKSREVMDTMDFNEEIENKTVLTRT